MTFEPYFLLKLAHILLFVYWLGADIGVFYSVRYVKDRELGLQARQTALKILGWIDQIPRYCLVLTLPVGYSLAKQMGVVGISSRLFLVLWIVTVAWLWMVWAIHHHAGTRFAERLRSVDLGWRWLLVAGLLWDGYQGLRGRGHLFADWVSLKFIIFSLLVFCGIMIRVRGKPLGPALRDTFAQGSTPEREAVITASFASTRPWVLAIWTLLLVAAYVGISKPMFPGG